MQQQSMKQQRENTHSIPLPSICVPISTKLTSHPPCQQTNVKTSFFISIQIGTTNRHQGETIAFYLAHLDTKVDPSVAKAEPRHVCELRGC
jgi:hypothetical protein